MPGLLDKWPFGMFSDYWGFGILSRRKNGMAPPVHTPLIVCGYDLRIVHGIIKFVQCRRSQTRWWNFCHTDPGSYIEGLIQAFLSTLLCEGLTTPCIATERKSYTSELFNMNIFPRAVASWLPTNKHSQVLLPPGTPNLCSDSQFYHTTQALFSLYSFCHPSLFPLKWNEALTTHLPLPHYLYYQLSQGEIPTT